MRAVRGVRRKNETTNDGEGSLERTFVESVGVAIRRGRRARGWTQIELARLSRLSSNYVARLERGELGPSLWVAHRIARALGVPLDALLTSQPSPPALTRRRSAKRRT